MATGKQRRQMEAWLTAHTRKGARCSECSVVFTVDQGDGKRLAHFPNGAGGTAFYVLCKICGCNYERDGLSAIPNVQRDSKITATMSPHARSQPPRWLQ
jgi:hypothetical protein